MFYDFEEIIWTADTVWNEQRPVSNRQSLLKLTLFQCSSLMTFSLASLPLQPSSWFALSFSIPFSNVLLFLWIITLVPEKFLQGFSPDASLLLFATEVQNIWRHSFTARYIPCLREMATKLFKNRNLAGIWSLTLRRTAPRRFWEKERWPSFPES